MDEFLPIETRKEGKDVLNSQNGEVAALLTAP